MVLMGRAIAVAEDSTPRLSPESKSRGAVKSAVPSKSRQRTRDTEASGQNHTLEIPYKIEMTESDEPLQVRSGYTRLRPAITLLQLPNFSMELNIGEEKITESGATDTNATSNSGWDARLTFLPRPDTRLGITVQSGMTPGADPDLIFSAANWPADLLFGGRAVRADGVSLSAQHRLHRNWEAGASVARYSSVQGETQPTPDMVVPIKWDETWRYAVGLFFIPSERWTMRAGVLLDQLPAIDRHARETGTDPLQIGAGAGLNFRPDRSANFTISYTRLFPNESLRQAKRGGNPEFSPELPSGWGEGLDLVIAQLSIQF